MTDKTPDKKIFFAISGSNNAPWELNRPQPAIVDLVQRGIFHGNVLDIGCGIGDNAIFIAKNCNDVKIQCIDMVANAVDVARNKAKEAGLDNISFAQVDILQPVSNDVLPRDHFDIVLDSAVFHVFSDDERLVYAQRLGEVIKSGGLYVQLVFSEKEQIRKGGPRFVKVADLEAIFSTQNGWRIESHEDSIIESRPGTVFEGNASGYLTIVRRL